MDSIRQKPELHYKRNRCRRGGSKTFTSTQAQVDAAVNSLNAAMDTYEAAVVTPIAEADLIVHYTFNEGTGTTITDMSANELNGIFKNHGPVAWGAGIPEWAEDRNGEAGMALHFDDGGNVEIPYNTKLNPESMTISLWINADEINENNRFLGLQSWVAYKFQLQSAEADHSSRFIPAMTRISIVMQK